ncbi:MAG: UDP-N-acetylmuramoyl-tripeptide--D-alanyl-D-alanine ligase [Prolixibacteraceae bacterium]|nr:UDP-N-acetylmuramoyl-tripeptide--D-alanyl-D-alanine ligase [Prolixibacteraceae bacterium]
MDTDQLYKLFLKTGRVFTDSRKTHEGGIFVALKGEHFDGNDFALKALNDGAEYALVDSEKLKGEEGCIFVDDSLKTLQKLANYHRRKLNIPVIAITGTNGKTTTKELIAAVLLEKCNVLATQGNLNNHIGVPLTLLTLHNGHEIAVVEMGANHPGEISTLCKIAEPDYGLITNVGKAHIEGFGSFEGVKKTKAELYSYISEKGKSVFINTGNKHLLQMIPPKVEKISYGQGNENVQLKGEAAGSDPYLTCKILFPRGWLYIKTKLVGDYNLENVLAAARVGMHFNIDPLLIKKAIEGYRPSNNRSQLTKIGSNKLFVDCYNANPTSMEMAIKNFVTARGENKILILGDMLELGAFSGGEHQKIIDLISGYRFDDVFLVGENFLKTNSAKGVHKFNTVDELIAEVDFSRWNNKLVLVKGSRAIKLEKIIEAIKKPV